MASQSQDPGIVRFGQAVFGQIGLKLLSDFAENQQDTLGPMGWLAKKAKAKVDASDYDPDSPEGRTGSALLLAITLYSPVKTGVKKESMLLLNAPRQMQDHHLFPRQFKVFFDRRGIDIDAHTVSLGDVSHLKGVHGSGLGNMPGQWNRQWSGWISQNPNATVKETYQQLGVMMDKYNLSGLPIHPYRK